MILRKRKSHLLKEILWFWKVSNEMKMVAVFFTSQNLAKLFLSPHVKFKNSVGRIVMHHVSNTMFLKSKKKSNMLFLFYILSSGFNIYYRQVLLKPVDQSFQNLFLNLYYLRVLINLTIILFNKTNISLFLNYSLVRFL